MLLICYKQTKAQTAYITSCYKIYYIDLNTFNIIDEYTLPFDFTHMCAIAQNSDGLLYGTRASFIDTTVSRDTLYSFNPTTKILQSTGCVIKKNKAELRTSGALCFDDNDNLIFYGYDSITNTNHLYKYNINSCSIVQDYDFDTIVNFGGDLEYVNGYVYATVRNGNMLWQIDMDAMSAPVPIFNTYPPYVSYYGLFSSCINDTLSFLLLSNYTTTDIISKINLTNGELDTVCYLTFAGADMAFYFPDEDENFFYLGKDTTVCNGTPYKLKTKIPGTIWSTGQIAPNITVTQAGKYWATYTNSCGTFSDTINIDSIVQQKLKPFRDTIVCKGSTLKYVSNLPATRWNAITADSIQFTALRDTVIYVRKAFTCHPNDSMRDTIVVKVDTITNIQVSANATTYCNTPVTLTKNNSNAVWNTGSSANQIQVNSAGKYWATLTNTCGTFSDTVEILSFSSTTLNIGSDTTICANTNFIIKSNLAKTIWSSGDTAQQITVNSADTYWASIKDSCNTYTDTIHITAYIPETVVLSNDTIVCKNTTLTITSTNANTQFGNDVVANQLTVTVTKDTIVIGKVINKCASSGFNADTVVIKTITEVPLLLSSETTVICDTETVVLNSSILNTIWTLPDSTLITDKSIIINKTGTYFASYQSGCSAFKDSIIITQFCNEYCIAEVPTAFSPNGDMQNDQFQIFVDCKNIESFLLKIYNRWGELLFETDNYLNNWDGNHKGQAVPLDTYIWYLEYSSANSKQSKKGAVTVVR